MKGQRLAAAGLALCLLTGCAPLLERSYTVSEPHSSKLWESEAAGTLRAENHQDIVNDLLILIGQHTESAVLRLYGFEDDQAAMEQMDQAMLEVQQETPLGAYAVEYITAVEQPQRSCYEMNVQISYRRSAEQVQTIVNATSPSALHDLLTAALDGDRAELVVRVSYWQADSREKVEQALTQVRQERGVPVETVWLVHYYPETDPVGIKKQGKQAMRRQWRKKRACFEEAALFVVFKRPQTAMPRRCSPDQGSPCKYSFPCGQQKTLYPF